MTKSKAAPRVDRREQALAFVASCGIAGATWKELAAATGIHHGSASGALSNLHRAGRIARLAEGKRERCAPYVLPDLVAGRLTSPPGRNASKAVQDLVDAGWQIGYDAAMAERGETPDLDAMRQDAYVTGIQRGHHDEALGIMRLVVEMRREIKRKGRVHAHSSTCWMDYSDCALGSVEKALLKTLPPPQKMPAA